MRSCASVRMSTVKVRGPVKDGPRTIEAWVSDGEALANGLSSSQEPVPSVLIELQP